MRGGRRQHSNTYVGRGTPARVNELRAQQKAAGKTAHVDPMEETWSEDESEPQTQQPSPSSPTTGVKKNLIVPEAVVVEAAGWSPSGSLHDEFSSPKSSQSPRSETPHSPFTAIAANSSIKVREMSMSPPHHRRNNASSPSGSPGGGVNGTHDSSCHDTFDDADKKCSIYSTSNSNGSNGRVVHKPPPSELEISLLRKSGSSTGSSSRGTTGRQYSQSMRDSRSRRSSALVTFLGDYRLNRSPVPEGETSSFVSHEPQPAASRREAPLQMSPRAAYRAHLEKFQNPFGGDDSLAEVVPPVGNTSSPTPGIRKGLWGSHRECKKSRQGSAASPVPGIVDFSFGYSSGLSISDNIHQTQHNSHQIQQHTQQAKPNDVGEVVQQRATTRHRRCNSNKVSLPRQLLELERRLIFSLAQGLEAIATASLEGLKRSMELDSLTCFDDPVTGRSGSFKMALLTAVAQMLYVAQESAVLIVGFIYMNRLAANRVIALTPDNMIRLYQAGCLVASKVYVDRRVLNVNFAHAVGHSVALVTQMELRFLSLMDFNIWVEEEDYDQGVAYVRDVPIVTSTEGASDGLTANDTPLTLSPKESELEWLVSGSKFFKIDEASRRSSVASLQSSLRLDPGSWRLDAPSPPKLFGSTSSPAPMKQLQCTHSPF